MVSLTKTTKRLLSVVAGVIATSCLLLNYAVIMVGFAGVLWMCASYGSRLVPGWIGIIGGIILSPLIFEWLPLYAWLKDGFTGFWFTAIFCWGPIAFAGMTILLWAAFAQISQSLASVDRAVE